MKVGIMGAGNIAAIMTKTIQGMEDVTCCAIASRSKEKAELFAKKYQLAQAYATYEELVTNSDAELIYIATPHSEHFDNVKLCIEHGKPVLCEKAFMLNAAQAKEIIALAKEKRIFLAEAIWTRYMPSRTLINDIIERGELGTVTSLTANLAYDINELPRLYDPLLAGGALLDVGIYPLTFASMVMGDNIVKITSTCTFTKTGVDEQNAVILEYPGNKLAVLHSGMLCASDQYGIVHGTNGFLIAKNINNVTSIEVYDASRALKYVVDVPKQITGYEYELAACKRALENGQLSCKEAPLEQSIHMMELMDTIRKQWGLRYPAECFKSKGE